MLDKNKKLKAIIMDYTETDTEVFLEIAVTKSENSKE